MSPAGGWLLGPSETPPPQSRMATLGRCLLFRATHRCHHPREAPAQGLGSITWACGSSASHLPRDRACRVSPRRALEAELDPRALQQGPRAAFGICGPERGRAATRWPLAPRARFSSTYRDQACWVCPRATPLVNAVSGHCPQGKLGARWMLWALPATPRGRSFYKPFYSCEETEAEKSETGLDGGGDVHSGSPAAVYVLPTADHPQLWAPRKPAPAPAGLNWH